MESAIEEIQLESTAEFFAMIRRSNDIWWEGKHCPWIFRGQWDAKWKLVPTAFRKGDDNKLNSFRAEAGKLLNGGRVSAVATEIFVQTQAEIAAIHHFSNLARDARVIIQAGPSNPFQNQRHFTNEDQHGPTLVNTNKGILVDSADSSFDQPCPNSKLLPLAQHHGVPTRLLDFTNDPIVATFFAVNRSFRPRNSNPERCAIWALKTNSRLLPDIQIIDPTTKDVASDEYILAQGGRFVLMRSASRCFDKARKWPCLEDLSINKVQNVSTPPSSGAFLDRRVREWEMKMKDLENELAANSPPLPLLRKICFPATIADEIANTLDRERVTQAHLMPTLDNVATTLFDRWQFADSSVQK